MEPARRTIGIVGCGAVGRALALALGGRGLLVSLWSRTRARAEELAADVGQGAAGRAEVVGFEELGRAEGVILSVHDDALSEVARELSCIEPLPACVLHTCGYHGTGVLEPLRREGVSCGKLHPLLSLPSDPPEAPGEERLFGGVFGVGGDAPALELACELVGRLGGREIVLRPGEEYDRLYHAAASLLSGGYVALVSAAVEAMGRALDPARLGDEGAEERALELLEALRRSTEENVHAGLGPRALTGPVARGAEALVAGHLEALGQSDPAAEELYRALAVIMRRLSGR